MPKKIVPAVLSLAVIVAGCGSSTASTPSSASQPADTQASSNAANPWKEATLRRLIGLRRSPVDLSYRLASHPECVTTNLLRSTAEVHTYKAAGDVVLTNRDGSAGVKASEMSPSCKRLFAQALANVR